MSKPLNPNEIVIRNNYYPSGLTEDDIYNYYIRNKNNILEKVSGREIFFFLATDVNNFIVRRYLKQNQFIKLNSENYEKTITGRTTTIISTMHRLEDFGIVDIDCDNFIKSKQATMDIYNYTLSLNYFKDIQIRYTGKNSFHVIVYYDKKKRVDSIRLDLRKRFLSSPLLEKYTLQVKRKQGVPNIDLSPNKYRGGFITEYSLSQLGLICKDVAPNKLISFNQSEVKIK